MYNNVYIYNVYKHINICINIPHLQTPGGDFSLA